jgi:hypothetical protein
VISVVEQVLREGRRGPLCRAFRDFAGIFNRGASRALQRRIVDFAAERSFHNTATALREHYNIEVPVYTIDKTTAGIARQAKHFNSQAPGDIKPAATLISEVDGSMLPVVSFRDEAARCSESGSTNPAGNRIDRRKLRQCHWKELRVSTVSVPGGVETWYGVALGEPMSVGCMMWECCSFKGMNEDTHIHAVADGADWIANQYEMQFGTRCTFLVDFYHVCEYLAEAVNSTSMGLEERNRWLETQKQALRESDIQAVIAALEGLCAQAEEKDANAPVTTAMAYLTKRAHQLDYQNAIAHKLPIGSGEVESAHRHILQKRLKIPGAWWRLERAEEMAQLRAMRANQRWDDFWQAKCA